MTFALPHPDDHATGVNVGDTQLRNFREPEAGGIGSHQNSEMPGAANRVKEPSDLSLAEHHGQSFRLLGIGDVADGPITLERDAIEETQRRDDLNQIAERDASLVDQIYLVLTNLFRPEQLRRLAEMPGEVGNAGDVGSDGVWRPVAYLQVLDHALTKSSHGKLLSETECWFGDKHYALLKGAFSCSQDRKPLRRMRVEFLRQRSRAYRVAVLSNG